MLLSIKVKTLLLIVHWEWGYLVESVLVEVWVVVWERLREREVILWLHSWVWVLERVVVEGVEGVGSERVVSVVVLVELEMLERIKVLVRCVWERVEILVRCVWKKRLVCWVACCFAFACGSPVSVAVVVASVVVSVTHCFCCCCCQIGCTVCSEN